MAGGLKRHLKCLNAPRHWMLDTAASNMVMDPYPLKVRDACFSEKEISYITTFDRCAIRYPDPLIKAIDTIKIEIETGKVVEFIKFDIGNIVMVTSGQQRQDWDYQAP
ncbi:hypothetical protein GOP47_0022636 [Adiantum capillus-veneris]|uniref:40S ribosomal protein S4 n=1 Tax=Adiantum capillus-veneris TaxID=13818 RepID=A0A9D4U6V1_ADICA|nr:hypothetical protein GOP47_0022636 [Adiantum capillus-veneris]